VVSDASSALDDAAEVKATINSNHMDMCRFSSKEDDGYCKIKQVLSGHVWEIKRGIEDQQSMSLDVI
jgi:hypothetical protein